MRRIAVSLAIALTGLLSACGQYTNFPARIHISGESNLVGEVTYAFDSANKPAVTVKNPKLTLVGEAGSIGITFDKMNITYTGVPDTFPKLNLTTGLRVDSSHNFERTVAGDKTIVAKLVQGKGVMDLPVVTPEVIKIGNPFNNAGGFISTPISAIVTLSGVDDALWPVEIQFGVPINFIRPGN
ncbi:MAG: hypothetical protein H7338_10210 [Candidatus Sericytochromatia bacterium]|nr:hypothetical protein [Candidatus Sericytochromatia bacterium]